MEERFGDRAVREDAAVIVAFHERVRYPQAYREQLCAHHARKIEDI